MDMGIQKTYLLITETGKQIRTTAEHPYLVRGKELPDQLQSNESQEESYHDNTKSNLSSNIDIFKINLSLGFSNHANLLNRYAAINEIIPPAILPVNNQNLILDLLAPKGTINAAPNHPAAKLTNSSDRMFKNRESISPTLSDDILTVKPKWLKVSQIKKGMFVATINGWEKVVAVKAFAREQVFDIEVNNTHNFVGNNIVAHNTYINGGLELNGKLTVVDQAGNHLYRKC